MAATFIPEMEDLLLDLVADQILKDCTTKGKSDIVRLRYPDPASVISACQTSVQGAKSCWTVDSQLHITTTTTPQTVKRRVLQIIRHEFDFGDAVQKVIPNNVFLELKERALPLRENHARTISAGGVVGIALLLFIAILIIGATVKTKRWKSDNTHILVRRTEISRRRSNTEGFFPTRMMVAYFDDDDDDDDDRSNDDDDDDDDDDRPMAKVASRRDDDYESLDDSSRGARLT